MAVAEEFGADGLAALKGIAVGVETTCRLSLVAPMRVRRAGFHPTSVFGIMAGWPPENAEAARALVARLFEDPVDLTMLRG